MSELPSEPPDDELIRTIRRKENLPAAKVAFTTFYSRHIQFLYRCVRKADRQLVGYGLGTKDIVEETFGVVWQKAAMSFCYPSGLSPDALIRISRKWLATIASNLVKDRLKSHDHQLPYDPTEEIEGAAVRLERAGLAADHVRVLRAVSETLSERDAAIIWFKITYYNPETRKSQPPPDELDAFCREWKISPLALRKAYERAIASLSQSLSQSSLTHETSGECHEPA